MKYPQRMEAINKRFSQISGGLILLIGLMSVYEAIIRTFFNSPTIWTSDFSQYLLIWAIFIAGGYGFQELGHVKVDLFTGKLPPRVRKLAAIVSYFITMAFVSVLLYSSTKMFQTAIELNKKTIAMVQIPQWILIIAMVIGCILMIVTLVCMLVDLISGGKKYL